MSDSVSGFELTTSRSAVTTYLDRPGRLSTETLLIRPPFIRTPIPLSRGWHTAHLKTFWLTFPLYLCSFIKECDMNETAKGESGRSYVPTNERRVQPQQTLTTI